MFEASASTDRLVELILKEDREVLRQLLTTKSCRYKNDSEYFGQPRTKAARTALQKEIKKAAEEQKLREEAERKAWIAANPGKEPPKKKNGDRPQRLMFLLRRHPLKELTFCESAIGALVPDLSAPSEF